MGNLVIVLKCLFVESLYIRLSCSNNRPFDDGFLKDTVTIKRSLPSPPHPPFPPLCLSPSILKPTTPYRFLSLLVFFRAAETCVEISEREKKQTPESKRELQRHSTYKGKHAKPFTHRNTPPTRTDNPPKPRQLNRYFTYRTHKPMKFAASEIKPTTKS